MKDAGFSGEERLKKRTAIEALLKAGKRMNKGEISAISLRVQDERHLPIKVVIAVPKRKFKRAVDRNLLKRRIREAYRKNKQACIQQLQDKNISIDLMFIYQGEQIMTYTEIEEKIVLLLKGLLQVHA